MNLKNRIKYTGMAAALALSLTTPAFAGAVTNTGGAYDPTGKGGDTIISVYETTVDTGNLSVEVPLYLTLVVAADTAGGANAKLLAPQNYHIANTSKKVDGSTASYPVAVTGVYIDRMGDWSLKTYNQGADGEGAGTGTAKDMTLNFSGKSWVFGGGTFTQEGTASNFDFPEVNAGAANVGVDIEQYGESLFYDGTNNRYKGINPGASLDITIKGGVATGYTVNANGTSAAPQFRVTYTVCALDPTTGDPIGTPYAGPNFGPFPHDGLLTDANKQTSNFDTDSNPIKKNP